jgi:hypothetical protein
MGFFGYPQGCVGKNETISGCLSKVNFFNRNYFLSPQSAVDCAGNATAGRIRNYAIYDTIVCGEDEDPNMWGIIEEIFGANEKGIPSTSVWRDTYCRPDYSFQIKNAVSGAAGATVTITIAQGSYSADGKASVPVTGSLVNLPGLTFPVARIGAIDRTVDFGWTVTLQPLKTTQSITLSANQRLFPQPGARLVGGGSCPVDETSAPTPGTLQHTQMVAIRSDWCVQRELNEGYDGVLQFAPAPVMNANGQLELKECWDAVAAQMGRNAMKRTRDQLLLVGNQITNTTITADITGYEGFEGYIPSVLNGGGFDYQFDPFTGFNMFQGMRAFARFAEANQRCQKHVWFVSPEFRRGLTDSMNETILGKGLGVCTFEAWGVNGTGQDRQLEYLGFEKFKVDNNYVMIKTMPMWASNRSYGIDGYAFGNMAISMPLCPIKTVQGNTVSPIEIFYPETECASGGYFETSIDERYVSRCQKIDGYMIQKFAAMYHCMEDHSVIAATVC